METVGTDVGQNHGSLHSPGWDPSAVQPLPGGAQYSDGFHTFAIEWDPGEVRFYVDGALYETQDQGSAPNGGWVFDGQPFFIIVNVAVGGNWPGSPDGTTVFPQKLLVDYVRVYQKK